MEATAPRTGPDPRRWWVLALLCGAFFIVLLDGTIVLVDLLHQHPLGLAALALSPLLVEAPDADWGSLQTILLVAGSVAVGATVAQAVVLKAGFRAVAATSMALLLLGRLRRTPRERLEAVPVPVSND